MTADSLFGPDDVSISIKEYQELIQLRKEVEKLKRENYGLKTTVNHLRETIAKQYGYRTFVE